LDIQVVPRTLQEVRDQREEAAKREVGRIRSLASECKQLSDRNKLLSDKTRSATTGGTTSGIDSSSAYEVTHDNRDNEEIARTTHGPTIDYCHPGQNNGSHTEATTSAG
jgi:hypothetical protein